MMQLYMEETEDMLQGAEECIIRLETEYSDLDVNELFRIAHTIKGSSHMVGYEDIGNVMHKIEDMLDCARNSSILFDHSIVSLCFEGLDTVKKMLLYKKEQGSKEVMAELVSAATKIKETIEVFIRVNKKVEEKTVIKKPEPGIISSYLSKKVKGENKYYITFFFEEDAPMVSPVILMILNSAQDIGSLVYSSIGDNYFSESSCDNDIKIFEIIISTDVDEDELYTYFALFYIEKINIVDLSRSKVAEKDYSFIDDENSLYIIILKAFMKLYKIAFSLSKEFNINKEDIDIIRPLYHQAVKAFSKMKNKNKIDNFTTDFNEIYNDVIRIYEDEVKLDQKNCEHIQTQVIQLMERAYNYTKGKHIFSVFKSQRENFISRLNDFIRLLNKSSTLILLIDLSKLTTLNENEVKDLIEIKKEIKSENIELGIIAEGSEGRRIINIFDSIKQIAEFNVFGSERHGILGIFNSEDSFNRISERVKGVK
ncbi:Hpt domain-containing protein [Clostridium estertheticum]|uniref:Hpt domain-containing protein n=1 Tax=Clostridium estertheticum TaxID=238834 RepID=UPI001CF201ED|nr:Hpt domain-containing protein [Clostridium estertheticum]MCB2306204.1 Hpt domain-containing protein [Clostridium estertheticum]MCB2344377.1 Hpt domain-containing protein [Clostridium estertheticum]MCB2349296.1 Hpt domain-containing protein [Clostridium estertheticum]WAG48012.1 Hpt domain-containing protein [Clostridium estertheticum]